MVTKKKLARSCAHKAYRYVWRLEPDGSERAISRRCIACNEILAFDQPSNDEPYTVRIEMRAAELGNGRFFQRATAFEVFGWHDHRDGGDHEPDPNPAGADLALAAWRAGWLARELYTHDSLDRDASAWAWDPTLPVASQGPRDTVPAIADGHAICPGCKQEIDTDTCHCGSATDGHNWGDGHSPVPMGCICHTLRGDPNDDDLDAPPPADPKLHALAAEYMATISGVTITLGPPAPLDEVLDPTNSAVEPADAGAWDADLDAIETEHNGAGGTDGKP